MGSFPPRLFVFIFDLSYKERVENLQSCTGPLFKEYHAMQAINPQVFGKWMQEWESNNSTWKREKWRHSRQTVYVVIYLSFFIIVLHLPVMFFVRYMADITPTEKAMLIDRNWPLVSRLVFTCAAAEQPNSFTAQRKGKQHRGSKVDIHYIPCCTVCTTLRKLQISRKGKADDTKQILEINMWLCNIYHLMNCTGKK